MSEAAHNQAGISQNNPRALRNPWVLGWIALVVVVLGVNAGMITTAIVTNPGLVDKNYYEEGRQLERNITKNEAARNALGWQIKLDQPSRSVMGQEAVYHFTAYSSIGLPLNKLAPTLTAYRPSDANADFTMTMKEIGPGQYEARPVFPLKGAWDVSVNVKHQEHDFKLAEKRIAVRPN